MHRRVAGQRKSMATWRNGSAFGFDRRRHQKVAGSSPAVVITFSQSSSSSLHLIFVFFLVQKGRQQITYITTI